MNQFLAACVFGVALLLGILSFPILGLPILIGLMYYSFKS